jgi:hypothetical protein
MNERNLRLQISDLKFELCSLIDLRATPKQRTKYQYKAQILNLKSEI